MLELRSGGIDVHFWPEMQENQSSLMVGKSGTGKTTLASLYGQELIERGNSVQLVDLGMKWSQQDKKRFLDAGAEIKALAKERVVLFFPTRKDLLGCGGNIVHSLGLLSMKAVSHLKNIFSLLMEGGNPFSLQEVAKRMKKEAAEDPWTEEIWQRLESCVGMPDIWFQVGSREALLMAETSKIWDLEGMEEFQMQAVAGLILYQLYCAQCERVRKKESEKMVHVILDECQDLPFHRKSITGICLTQGRKYGLSVILVTQLLQGRFSDAVLAQFKQSGSRFYFRMTEDEAAMISRLLSADSQIQKKLYQRLISLPRGHCLMIAPHSVGKRKEVSETMRFVEVVLQEETKKSQYEQSLIKDEKETKKTAMRKKVITVRHIKNVK